MCKITLHFSGKEAVSNLDKSTIQPPQTIFGSAADTARLASEIEKLAAGQARVLIAIAGAPGSGKSTFAEHLSGYLGKKASVIPMDGFHLDNSVLEAKGLLSVKGAPQTFDCAGFAGLVSGMKEGTIEKFPTFDRALDKVIPEGGQLSKEASILLFEGNYLLCDLPGWAGLADMWDAGIWLDVPIDILRTRLVRRWRDHGLSDREAIKRAEENDLKNARQVLAHALPARWVISQKT